MAIVAQDQLMPLVRAVLPRRPAHVFATSLAEMLPATPTCRCRGASAAQLDCPDATDLMPALRAVTAAAARRRRRPR